KKTGGEAALRDSSFSPQFSTFSEVAGYAIILHDITESRRSAEEEIESEKLSAVTLLAAGVAHEIGNPLNSLNIHLQLMERKARKLPAKVRREMEDSLAVARDEI